MAPRHYSGVTACQRWPWIRTGQRQNEDHESLRCGLGAPKPPLGRRSRRLATYPPALSGGGVSEKRTEKKGTVNASASPPAAPAVSGEAEAAASMRGPAPRGCAHGWGREASGFHQQQRRFPYAQEGVIAGSSACGHADVYGAVVSNGVSAEADTSRCPSGTKIKPPVCKLCLHDSKM